jgi:hypothetical protein
MLKACSTGHIMPALMQVAMRGQAKVQPVAESHSVDLKDFDLTNEPLKKHKCCLIFATGNDKAQIKAIS